MRGGAGAPSPIIFLSAAAVIVTAVLAAIGMAIGAEDIAWWWQTGRTDTVLILVPTDENRSLSEVTLREPGAVSRARQATQELIRKLEPMPPQEAYLVGYYSEVIFMDSTDPYEPLLHLTWDHSIDHERGRVSVDGKMMICRRSDWMAYLGALSSLEGEDPSSR